MIPCVEINIPRNNGDIEKWGLTRDDHCIVVLRYGEGGWERFDNAYIPSQVALHMGSIAATDISLSQAFDAAHSVMYPKAPVLSGQFELAAQTQTKQ